MIKLSGYWSIQLKEKQMANCTQKNNVEKEINEPIEVNIFVLISSFHFTLQFTALWDKNFKLFINA